MCAHLEFPMVSNLEQEGLKRPNRELASLSLFPILLRGLSDILRVSAMSVGEYSRPRVFFQRLKTFKNYWEVLEVWYKKTAILVPISTLATTNSNKATKDTLET